MKRILILAVLCLCACQSKETEEPKHVFSVDKTAISTEGPSEYSETITVTTNCKWSLMRAGSCEWVSVSPDTGEAGSATASDTKVSVTLAFNETFSTRKAVIYLVPEDNALQVEQITLSQGGQIPSLAVSSPLVVNDIPYSGGQVPIEIKSNTDWTASVMKNHTASVSLGSEKGNKDATLVVTVAANEEEAEKSATIVIEAEGCPAIEVVLNQNPAPHVDKLEIVEAVKQFADPKVFSSLGGKRWFGIKANSEWTAKVGPNTTAEDVVILNPTVTGDVSQFEITVGPNKDWDKRKTVEIIFTREGCSDVTVLLEQEKGSILGFEFRDQKDANGVWPFAEKAPTKSQNKATTVTYTVGGYSVKCYGKTEVFYEKAFGLRIGKGVGCWFETPAIPGRKLVSITLREHNVNTNPYVCDQNGNVVDGGGKTDIGVAWTANVPATWNLRNTEAGKAYRIISSENNTMRIYDLVLTYE